MIFAVMYNIYSWNTESLAEDFIYFLNTKAAKNVENIAPVRGVLYITNHQIILQMSY